MEFSVRRNSHYLIVLFALALALITSCSGNNLSSRNETDSESTTDATTNRGSSSQYANEAGVASQEITGLELTDIKVSSHCTTAQCTTVRYTAAVKKAGSTISTDFRADTLTALGIKSFSWIFEQLPANVVCASEGEDSLRFSPSCSRSVNASLANETLSAKLSLVFNDDSSVAGTSVKVAADYTQAVQGNFLKITDDVWRDLTENGLYFTKFIADPTHTSVNWTMAASVCALYQNFIGGAGTWRLPLTTELRNLSTRGLRIQELPNQPQVLWSTTATESVDLSTGSTIRDTISSVHYTLCISVGSSVADGITIP